MLSSSLLHYHLSFNDPHSEGANAILCPSPFPDQVGYGGQQPLAMVDEQLLSQLLSTPTMHPNLVSTLKSLIAPESKLHAPNSASKEVIGASIVPVDLIHNRRPFECGFSGCGKTFRNPQTLKMHHKTHSGHYSLAACPPACKKAGHNKKIPSKCPVCKRTFVGLYELRRHFGRKHSEGEKMHWCRKCGKRFYIEVDVRDHEKLCGEPLQCRCGMKFAFKCNLVAHKRAHPHCQNEVQEGKQHKSSPLSKGNEDLSLRQEEQHISCTLDSSASSNSKAPCLREPWLHFFHG